MFDEGSHPCYTFLKSIVGELKKMNTITLDQVIDTVMQLPFEQQEMLIDIIRRRHIENRRKEMAKDAQESIASFHAGKLKPQPIAEIITDLRRPLDETVEE